MLSLHYFYPQMPYQRKAGTQPAQGQLLARWGLRSAEAVLKLRSLHSSGDTEAYWAFHKAEEQKRNHPSRMANPPFSKGRLTRPRVVLKEPHPNRIDQHFGNFCFLGQRQRNRLCAVFGSTGRLLPAQHVRAERCAHGCRDQNAEQVPDAKERGRHFCAVQCINKSAHRPGEQAGRSPAECESGRRKSPDRP